MKMWCFGARFDDKTNMWMNSSEIEEVDVPDETAEKIKSSESQFGEDTKFGELYDKENKAVLYAFDKKETAASSLFFFVAGRTYQDRPLTMLENWQKQTRGVVAEEN